jgi:hypothetical protein
MEIRTLKTKFIKVSLWTDWIIIPVMIFIGMIGFGTSVRLGSWTQLIERSIRSSKVATLTSTEGLVRYRKAGFIAWQENLKSTTFASGDRLVTTDVGIAEILLNDLSEVRAASSTQLITQTGIRNTALATVDKRSWIKKLFKPLHTFPYIEIETGRIDVLFTKAGNPVPIMANGKLYHVEKGHGITLKDHRVSIEPLSRQMLNHSYISRKIHDVAPTVPQILAPLKGARFISTSTEQIEVPLRWKSLPLDLKAEVQIGRLDDPDFIASSQVSRNGALVRLPDGQYRWKVRTVSTSGQKSEWSVPHAFSIQEYVRGSRSIIPIESWE